MYQFDWDEKKNKANIKKHGVSFEEAKTAFYDDYGWLEYDTFHSSDEDRMRLIGYSLKGNILVVVHCIREGEIIRIISSRKATAKEIQGYQNRRSQ